MIHFFEKGQGQPLILLHGFCESSELWDPLAMELCKSFRVLCPDLPGFGRSPLNHSSFTLEDIAEQLESWMELHGIHSPILLGHSLGGYLALALLERLGTRVKAIGLMHSTALADEKEKIETRNRTLIFLKKYGVEKFVTSFIPPLFSQKNQAQFRGEIDGLILRAKPCQVETLMAYTLAMRDRKERLTLIKEFSGPSLLLAGTEDLAVKIESSRVQKGAFTHYVELQGVGHMGMIEEREKVLDKVRQFLATAMK